MKDDRRTAHIVGLSLTAICCLCFALFALGVSNDPPPAEAKLLPWQAEIAPVVLVNQTMPISAEPLTR
jgi:hypothetical protein